MTPLSKARLKDIESLVTYAEDAPPSPMNTDICKCVRDLLADSKFWRSAIAKVYPWVGTALGFDEREIEFACQFCGIRTREKIASHRPHKPDCAFLLAKGE